MFFQKKFFDKYWNFDNREFLVLLKKAQKWIKNRKNKKSFNIELNIFNSVSPKELWQFINKLSIFINSWIDIKWAFNILVKQTKNPYLKKIISEIRTNIDYWIPISESMMQYPKVFDNLLVALVWVWEKTWTLWKILAEVDKKLLENIELKRKVKWALIYPFILLFLTFSMVTFMMVFIIPKITESFKTTWTELPYLTQIIINISDFFRNDWYMIIIFIVWLVAIFKIMKKFYFWEMILWKIAINLPIFGYIIRQSNIVYFINSFSLLMEAWVLLLDALKTSSQVVPNIHYKREIIRIKNEVESWLTISKSLWLNLEYDTSVYLNKLFPEEFAYIVNTWEETWTLSESLKKIWNNYSSELKRYIGNLATMLEPFIIVIVWFLVWTIVIAIMLPFFKLWEIAKKL
jgi:type IV pilus assembly protein PilC